MNTQPSNAARNLDIEFKPGEIILKVPRGQQIDIDTLLTQRRDLVVRKYREAASKIRLLDGDTIRIRGTPHTITTNQTQEQPEPRVEIHGDNLIVHVKEMENPSAPTTANTRNSSKDTPPSPPTSSTRNRG